jgi:hypothetical protein
MTGLTSGNLLRLTKFPLASVTCMPKDISDHTPLLYVSDAGNLLAVEDSSLRSGG